MTGGRRKKCLEKETILMESFYPSFLWLVIVKADMVDQTSMLQHSFFEICLSRKLWII